MPLVNEGTGLRDLGKRGQRWLRGAWVIFRRDLLDILRDWRLVSPLVLLLLIFPVLALLSAEAATRYMAQFGAQLVAERLLPFLALATGFLPLTVCLIIPLETFVGEKERRTLEPLLAAPVSDLQLYVGKGLAALIVPTVTSLLGVTLYLLILIARRALPPDPALLLSLYGILSLHAVVMVAGAIVISTQSHSVRGANLLASFIILPLSMLLVFESSLLFWGSYRMLMIILCILLAYAVLLVRMGVALFNREQLLSAEFDTLDLRGMARGFWRALRIGDPDGLPRSGWDGLWGPIRRSGGALATLALLGLMGFALGWSLTPGIGSLPAEAILERLGPGGQNLSRSLAFPLTAWGIFIHNLRAVLVNTLLGALSLGLWVAFYPVGLMGFIGMLLRMLFTIDPSLGMAGILAVLPHGLVELPAVGLVFAGALRLSLTLLTPPHPRSLRDRLLLALADWIKLLGLAIPLLLLAAWIEAYLTPHLVLGWLAARLP